MNIKELNGRAIKKILKAKHVKFQWHNKNKSGGNFGIWLGGLIGESFQISGYYDTLGNVNNIRFGFSYSAGAEIQFIDFNDLMVKLLEIVIGIGEAKRESLTNK